MKTTVNVQIPTEAEILVKEGDTVDMKTPVAILKESIAPANIEIARLLKVHPQKMSQYLKTKIGDKIQRGDVLAEKRSFFSSYAVRSPDEGVVGEIDLSIGTLALSSINTKNKKIYATTPGRVKKISEREITLECEAKEFVGEDGNGERTWGKLHYIKGERTGVLDIPTDIEGSVVLVYDSTYAALAKMDAMGVRAVVTTQNIKESILPYLVVNKNTFTKVEENSGREAIIDPKNKKIYILE